ncbi:hypothetical protein VF21_05496 [Pseudogymnoascus sp. 05NY08]|nr:hypothetical protein VF21_05496 [Pseudogymnoascus sp. 05NY08]
MACEDLLRKDLGEILSGFLCSIDFYMPPFDYDFSLEEPVMDHFEVQPWPEAYGKKAVKMAKWMSTGIGMCYPFADRETQIAYGIYSVYVLLICDITRELGSSMDRFAVNLVLGNPQESPVLQSLVDWLGGSLSYQGPFAAAMSIKSVIEFIRGCIIERDYDGNIALPRGAINFPEYFRSKTGIAEPFTHFCFPEALYPESEYLHVYLPALQDICDYINHTNDILSLYKESIVGEERLTYIPNYAQTHGLSLTDALRQVCENVGQNDFEYSNHFCRLSAVAEDN